MQHPYCAIAARIWRCWLRSAELGLEGKKIAFGERAASGDVDCSGRVLRLELECIYTGDMSEPGA